MANRYWVGGTANWDETAGTKWALTSGGTGGQPVPTSLDDVYFDANSGAVTVTASGSISCRNLSTTGFTGTLNNGSSSFLIQGDIYLGSGTNLAAGASEMFFLLFVGTSSNINVNMNGVSYPDRGLFIFGGGTVTLIGDMNGSAAIEVDGTTTLDTNGYSVSANFIGRYSGAGASPIINLGSSIITLNKRENNDAIDMTNVTLNSGTSTVILSGENSRVTTDGGTFYKVVFNSTYSIVLDDGIFFNIIINAGKKAVFAPGSTQTINYLTSNGYPGNLSNIESSDVETPFTLVKEFSGVIQSAYMSLKACATSGPADWIAINSSDGGSNTGWSFISDPGLMVYCPVYFFDVSSGVSSINQTAQTFIAPTTFKVSSVKFLVAKEYENTANIVAKLYSTSGGVPNTLLATSEIVNLSTFPLVDWENPFDANFGLREFKFSTPYEISGGNKYAISLEVTTEGYNYLMASDNLNSEFNGTGYFWDGSDWVNNLGYTYIFYLYKPSSNTAAFLQVF